MAAATGAIEQQRDADAAALLDRTPAHHRGWEYDHLRARLVRHDATWGVGSATGIASPVLGPSGQRLYAVLKDQTVAVLEASTGRLLRRSSIDVAATGNEQGGRMTLSGATRRYAGITSDRSLVVGDLDARASRQVVWPASGDHVHVAAWNKDGTHLAFRVHGELHFWDGDRAWPCPLDVGPVGKVAFSADGRRLAAVSRGQVSLMTIPDGLLLAKGRIADTGISAAFSPDGTVLAVGGFYRNVHLLDGTTLAPLRRLTGHRQEVYSLSWSPDGSRLASVCADGTVRVWDVEAGRSVAVLPGGLASADGGVGFTARGDGVWVAGNGLTRYPLSDPTVLRGHRSYVYNLAFSPDGRTLASGGSDGEIILWDPATGQSMHRLEPRVGIEALGFSRDSRLVAVMTRGTVRAWDVSTGELRPLAQPEERLVGFAAVVGHGFRGGHQVATSPDRRRVLVGMTDGEVLLLDHPEVLFPDRFSPPPIEMHMNVDPRRLDPSVTPLARLGGHVGQVYAVAWSPDGSRFATGADDATIRLWDAETLETVLVLRGHGQYVHALRFSPDGSMLASASGDGSVRLWDTKPLPERRASARPH